MQYDPEQAARVLERTPAVLTSLLHDQDAGWVRNNYGPDTFSPFDVLGHLIHGERTDWIPRAKRILEHGTSIPFEPFDRFAMRERSQNQKAEALLATFSELRAANVKTLRALQLTPSDLERKGMHPELGEVTLGHHLSMWVVHDLGHLAQIARCMAFQYKDQIGPWLADTTILKGL